MTSETSNVNEAGRGDAANTNDIVPPRPPLLQSIRLDPRIPAASRASATRRLRMVEEV